MSKVHDYIKLLLSPIDHHACTKASYNVLPLLLHTDDKFNFLGQLLKNGDFEAFEKFSKQIEFNEISADDRYQIANIVFSLFIDLLISNKNEASTLAAAILELITNLNKSDILSHQLSPSTPQSALLCLNYAKNIRTSVNSNCKCTTESL